MKFEIFRKRVIETLQATGFFPGQTHEDAVNELGELAATVEEMYKNGRCLIKSIEKYRRLTTILKYSNLRSR